MSFSPQSPFLAASRGPVPRVLQAFFAEGRGPAVRPHPATVAQAFAAQRPPHPATVSSAASPKQAHPATIARAAQPFFRPDARPPHPATLGRAAGPQPAAARAAPQAAQRAVDTHAFQTPAGFLEGAPDAKGQALPPPVQRKMEAFFGADFSDVRVHVGAEATSIGALAFTIGSDLYFAPGQYEPHSPRGQELIGHELTHVLQQREGRVANPFGAGVAVVQDPALEAEADRLGKEAAAQPRMATSARPPHAALAGRPVLSAAPAAQPKPAPGGYELVVGAYLHPDADHLPDELAGHSFVAIRKPGGEPQAFGFSPANFSAYDPKTDLGRLQNGVTGVVHDDAGAFEKPGVKTRSYAITPAQAQAAMAKVSEYKSGKYPFSLRSRQCSTFAFDILRAASIAVPAGGQPRKPREMYADLPASSGAAPRRAW